MKTTVTIKGTHCDSCKMLIEDVCRDIPGITSCSVDFTTGKTDIEHDETVDWERFRKEIENFGGYTLEKN